MPGLFSSFTWLPGRCLVCHRASQRALDLCSPCEDALPHIRHRCRHCGLAMPADCTQCGDCQRQPLVFQRCLSPLVYRDTCIPLVQALKYHNNLPAIRVLGELLKSALAGACREWPELILPVPLHWRRLQRRGYNQAGLLAGWLGRELHLPVRYRVLQRTRPALLQQGLNRQQRQSNLAQAFSLRNEPGVRHIALVDDVVTTGATANALAALLLQAGVEQVDVWCLARTPRDVE